jgi:hypothetical protein
MPALGGLSACNPVFGRTQQSTEQLISEKGVNVSLSPPGRQTEKLRKQSQ